MSQAWTPRRAAVSSRRSIKALRAAAAKHLDNIALCWADEDSYLEHEAENVLDRLNRDLDDLEKQIKHAVAGGDSQGGEG